MSSSQPSKDSPGSSMTPMDRLLLLETWSRSGLSTKDFSRIVNLSSQRLSAWRRRFEKDGPAGLDWRPMRKGIADTWRRAEVSKRANERYLHTLTAADTSERVGDLLAKVSRRVKWKGRSARALRPSDSLDLELFRLLGSGEFALQGLRNRDIQQAFYAKATRDRAEKRRRSGRATRLLRLLRAHGLVRKIPRTHRYQITSKGLEISAAVLASQAATVQQLAAA